MCCHVMVLLICILLSWKTLNHRSSSRRRGRVVYGADLPVVAWRGGGSNPAGDIHVYFNFEFFAPCYEQLSGTYANEIMHDHSPVVIVVLDNKYDKSCKALYTYSHSISLNTLKCIGRCFKLIHSETRDAYLVNSEMWNKMRIIWTNETTLKS